MTGDATRAGRPSTRLRRAGVSDAELLAALGRRTFEEAFAAENRPEDMAAHLATAFVPARIADDLADPALTYLVADRLVPGLAPEPIGYALLAPEPPPACVKGPRPLRLVKLYVVAAAVGGGVGAALLAECIERARRAGHGSLWLGVWEHNARARAFYARWGFEEVGTEPFQLGSDLQTDLLLERPVPPV